MPSEVTLLDFVRLTRSHLRLILAMLALGLLAAVGWTMTRPVLYTSVASGQVFAGSSASTSEALSGLSLAASKALVYASYVDGEEVHQRVLDELSSSGHADVAVDGLSASVTPASPEVVVSATSDSPRSAQLLADAAVRATAKVALAAENQTIPVGSGQSSIVRLSPVGNATLPTSPSSPSFLRDIALGAIAGLALGYAAALARRALDVRIRSVTDVEQTVGRSVLTVVPETRSLDRSHSAGVESSSRGPAAEALRQLRTNLRFVDVDHPPRCLVVTSANASEGKSTVSANLARVLAAGGQPTVLIDADLRRPMIAGIFDVDGSVGLTEVLAGDVTLEAALRSTAQPQLALLPAGRIPPNPSELLGSKRMERLLQELKRDYLVILDAPPLLPVTDAGLLSGIADGTLLVIAVGKAHREQAKLCVRRLQQVGGHLVGVVLNRAPVRGLGSILYGDGYGSYVQGYAAYAADDSRIPTGRRRRASRLGRPERRPRGSKRVVVAPSSPEAPHEPTHEPTVEPIPSDPGPVGSHS